MIPPPAHETRMTTPWARTIIVMERPIFPHHPRRIAPCLRGVRGPEAPVIRAAAGRVLRELFFALECVFPFVKPRPQPPLQLMETGSCPKGNWNRGRINHR